MPVDDRGYVFASRGRPIKELYAWVVVLRDGTEDLAVDTTDDDGVLVRGPFLAASAGDAQRYRDAARGLGLFAEVERVELRRYGSTCDVLDVFER